MSTHHSSVSVNHPHDPHAESCHPHVLPLKMYFAVWAALMFLTAVTVLVSYWSQSLLIAMLVASVKASLVLAYFMHLKYDHKINLALFVSALVFLVIFFYLTFADVATRSQIDPMQGNKLEKYPKKEQVIQPSSSHH